MRRKTKEKLERLTHTHECTHAGSIRFELVGAKCDKSNRNADGIWVAEAQQYKVYCIDTENNFLLTFHITCPGQRSSSQEQKWNTCATERERAGERYSRARHIH